MFHLLHDTMANQRTNLENEVFLRMYASGFLKDHHLDEQVFHDRVANLVDAFIKSMHEGPQTFITFIEDLTMSRIDEGIALHELHLALQALEEKSWSTVVKSIPMADQVPCLSQITQTIGTAKDHIARIYLQHLEQAEAALILLQNHEDLALTDDVNWQRGSAHPNVEMA